MSSRWYKAEVHDNLQREDHALGCPGVLVHVHEKGWMDENGMQLWIKVWKCPGGLIKNIAYLVYDMFKAHLVKPVKKELNDINTDVAIILGGLTNQLQPLDVSISKPFKREGE